MHFDTPKYTEVHSGILVRVAEDVNNIQLKQVLILI
jgi:hypothetical protein